MEKMNEITFIPQFTPKFEEANRKAFACGNSGLIANACGSSIIFSFFENKRLMSTSPIAFANSPITCLTFHPSQKILIAGDYNGNIYFYSLPNQTLLSIFKNGKYNEPCCAISVYDNNLLALFRNKYLLLISLPVDKEETVNLIWEVSLQNEFTELSIDPFMNNNILLFNRKTNLFSIYKTTDFCKKPEPLFERIELAQNYILDAQWSFHLPGYIFFILPNEVLLFHVESQIVFPIISQRQTSSTFESLLQNPNDFSTFIVLLKNGGITVFKTHNNNNFEMIYDQQPLCQSGQIVSATTSPLHTDYAFMFHSSLGIGVFDLLKNRIISFNMIFPSLSKSFDCDGTNYAIGTEDGYIISGSIYEPDQQKRYSVTSGPITFINFDAAISRIYWQSEGKIGVVSIAHCSVETFTSKCSNVVRCFGSRHGCLIVQRDLCALGVFIEGKEYPLILSTNVVDLAINESESSSSQGSFTLVTKTNEICFFKYSTKSGVLKTGKSLKLNGISVEPLCFAAFEDSFATGFANGSVLFYNGKETSQFQTNLSNLRELKFSSNGLFGLAKTNTLFRITTTLSICPYPVKQFNIVDDKTILVMCADNSVRFALICNWSFVHFTTKYCAYPADDNVLATKFINDPTMLYMSVHAKDAWHCLAGGNTNLRLQAQYGHGEKGKLEEVCWKMLERADFESHEFIHLKIVSLIFADKFTEAAELLFDDNDGNHIFSNSLLTSVLYQLDGFKSSISINSNSDSDTSNSNTSNSNTNNSNSNTNNSNSNVSNANNSNSNNYDDSNNCKNNHINDKVLARLKSSAISLCEAGKYEEGSILFRLGGLDKIAVNCLIDYGQDEYAIRFIRNCLDKEEKKRSLYRFGCKMYENKKLSKAIAFFAAADEYHTVLMTLFSLELFVDSYFMMKHLKDNNLIHETHESLARFYPEKLTALDDLCNNITTHFKDLLQRLKIDFNQIVKSTK